MKKLYFIRHGLSEMNKQGLWSGSLDTPLTSEGRAQAKSAAQHVKNLKIDYIVSSPLSRARETAEIIALQIGYPKSKIELSKLLVERHWGDLEGLPQHEDTNLESIPNIEAPDALLERARQALEFLEKIEADNVLVVSHGSFGRALRHHIIEDMPFVNKPSSPDIRLPNGEVICWI